MSRETWEPEVRRCRNCGRQFGMLHPTRWAYKRPKGARYEYFCSWGCLRADEKKDERKEEKEVKTQDKTQRTRMNTKDMEKAVEMLKNGDKALDQFLKNHGITNIYKWKYNIRTRHGIQKPEEPAVELVYDPTIAEEYRREQAQKEANERVKAEAIKKIKDIPQIKVPEHEQDKRYLWTTTAIRNEYLGVFYYDRKYNTVDWRHPAGEEISLPPADWNLLANALPEIMRTLGVDQQEIEKEV